MPYADDLARLQRKRSLAQALIQQSAAPQGMQAGRFFVGPSATSSLASLASIIAGGVMDRKYEKQEKDLNEGRRKQLADALRGITGQPTAGIMPGEWNQPSAGIYTENALRGISGLPAGNPSEGLVEPGNINLNNRPIVKMTPEESIDTRYTPDGKPITINTGPNAWSTVHSFSVGIDGKEVLLPMVSDDGRLMSKQEAIEQFKRTGKHLGKFSSVDAANRYAAHLHDEQEKQYQGAHDSMVGARQPQADPQRESMLQFLQGLPLAQQEALVGQQALAKLFPSAKDGFTLGKGERRYDASGRVIAEGTPDVKDPVTAIQEYQQAQKDGFKGSFFDYQLALKKAGATNVSTQVNTEKNLYGTMADAQGKANVDLYGQAQKAPELISRAQRVKAALGSGSQVITGAGAEQLLGLSKIAAQFGFNTGDAAADTESLARELASATLDNIKSSGLGGGTGFSNADRDFLEKAVGGKITLEAKTLRRLADLNEKSALATIQRWNATASRLKPEQLQELGMAPIQMPTGTPSPTATPKLTRNPDGSYTYSP